MAGLTTLSSPYRLGMLLQSKKKVKMSLNLLKSTKDSPLKLWSVSGYHISKRKSQQLMRVQKTLQWKKLGHKRVLRARRMLRSLLKK